MPVGHLHVCFGEMSVEVFHQFLVWVICFFDIELRVVVQLLSPVQLFRISWTATHQISLSLLSLGVC